jgi:hypothetical protein
LIDTSIKLARVPVTRDYDLNTAAHAESAWMLHFPVDLNQSPKRPAPDQIIALKRHISRSSLIPDSSTAILALKLLLPPLSAQNDLIQMSSVMIQPERTEHSSAFRVASARAER